MAANPSSTKPPGCTWQLELIDPRAPFLSHSLSLSLTRTSLNYLIMPLNGISSISKNVRIYNNFFNNIIPASVSRAIRIHPGRAIGIFQYTRSIYYNRGYISKVGAQCRKTYETSTRSLELFWVHKKKKRIKMEKRK